MVTPLKRPFKGGDHAMGLSRERRGERGAAQVARSLCRVQGLCVGRKVFVSGTSISYDIILYYINGIIFLLYDIILYIILY